MSDIPPVEEDEGGLVQTFYSSDPRARLNMPFSTDCSGYVWWSYNQVGKAQLLFPDPNGGVSEMIHHFERTKWRFADLIMQWNFNVASTRLAQITLNQLADPARGVEDFIQPGDLLYRHNSPSGAGDHVAFFLGWNFDKLTINDASPTELPTIGNRLLNYDSFIDTYTHVIRPVPIGSYMVYRYRAEVPQAVIV